MSFSTSCFPLFSQYLFYIFITFLLTSTFYYSRIFTLSVHSLLFTLLRVARLQYYLYTLCSTSVFGPCLIPVIFILIIGVFVMCLWSLIVQGGGIGQAAQHDNPMFIYLFYFYSLLL